ncbi:MAG TPA: hypothetical protein VF041_01400 [Gemmatimonadaceae bacterium]
MTAAPRPLLFVAVAALAACGGDGGHGAGRAPGHAAVATPGPRAASGPVAANQRAPATAGTPHDEWSPSEVVKRLSEAGLVVTDPHQRAHHEGLGVSGERLQVSGADVEVYLFPDADTRRRAAQAMDTVAHVLPSVYLPRYVFSGNLIAIVRTPNDHTAERIETALTARHAE